MKIQKLFLSILAAASLFAGCKEPEPEPTIPSLTVGQTELSFEQGGGTGNITVTSNRPWTISTDADWLAFDPSNGNAADAPVTVTVTALANSSTDRTASFKVKTDFDFRTVEVSQKGAKGEDPNVTPSGSGTANDPYNVAAALEKAKSLQAFNNGDDPTSSNSANVYTAGKVVSVDIDPGYGNATYFISADGTSAVQLEVYRGKYLEGVSFTAKDQLKVGDEVVVYGTLVNFKGETPEYTAGSKLISVNGETKAPEIDYTKFPLTNVGAFIEKAAKGEFFRLKGKVSRFNAQYCSFDLTDDSGTIYVYSVTNKDEWTSKISNGGTVELAGMYDYYEKNSQHEVVNAQILSFEAGQEDDYENAEPKTVAEFISAANKTTYFKLTGTVSKFNAQYCSFDLTDDSGTIYVYSVANKADWSSKISNDGTVTLAGKYDYYEKNSQHEVIEAYILSFEAAAPPETQDATVADAIAAAKDAVLKVGPAVVVASSSVGFLMEQDGAMIYVYGGEAAVGDNVTVEATRGEYQGVPQLTSPKVTVNSTGAAITYPTAKDITSTFSAYSSDFREFVTFKGKLNISGNYYNVEVAGSTTVTGSIVKPVEDISSLSGKEVTITGYYLYHTSQGKYLYVIPTKINDIAINGAGGGDTPGGDTPGGDTPGDGSAISWKANTDWTGVADGAETISYKSGNFTITAKKEKSSNKPTVNEGAKDCRVYAKGSLTITTSGDAMTSIVFNLSSQGQKRLTDITASTGTVAKQAKGDKTVTWTGSAKTVTFTVGEKAVYGSDGETKAGQFDFSSIVIK